MTRLIFFPVFFVSFVCFVVSLSLWEAQHGSSQSSSTTPGAGRAGALAAVGRPGRSVRGDLNPPREQASRTTTGQLTYTRSIETRFARRSSRPTSRAPAFAPATVPISSSVQSRNRLRDRHLSPGYYQARAVGTCAASVRSGPDATDAPSQGTAGECSGGLHDAEDPKNGSAASTRKALRQKSLSRAMSSSLSR